MLGILLLTLSLQVTPVDPTTIHFFSSLAGQQFDSAVTQALLDAAPKWATGSGARVGPATSDADRRGRMRRFARSAIIKTAA